MLASFWRVVLEHVLRWTTQLAADGMDITPSSCLHHSHTLQALVSCLDKFTVPHAFYDAVTYDRSQPLGTQRTDWSTLVQRLLQVDGDCSSIQVPSSLQDIYGVEPWQDYCVLHEVSAPCDTYLKGWGFLVVPISQTLVSRNTHISAPHPGYDLGTVQQASSIFQTTGSRSLLVAGRTRTAFLEPSGCVAPTSSSHDYFKTDPAHNNLEPFFDASIAIYDWQHGHGGCPSSSCAFIQIHGKGDSTCLKDAIFLSSGLGNSSASKAWYTDSTDRPVKRLQESLRVAFPSWRVTLPSESNCPLTATKNVVGRRMNGVDVEHVCTMSARSKHTLGEFIHAEQARTARTPEHYAAWSEAVKAAFDVTCPVEMVLHEGSKLCVKISPIPGDEALSHTHHIWSVVPILGIFKSNLGFVLNCTSPRSFVA